MHLVVERVSHLEDKVCADHDGVFAIWRACILLFKSQITPMHSRKNSHDGVLEKRDGNGKGPKG